MEEAIRAERAVVVGGGEGSQECVRDIGEGSCSVRREGVGEEERGAW